MGGDRTPMQQLFNFLNSNFFIALITFIVGGVALLVYLLRKRDYKRDAANVILLEIQNAERKLRQIKKELDVNPANLPNDLRLLPTNSWTNTKHLFIKDFDRDEWDIVSNFYHKCELIDETIKYNNAAFWNDVEQIRANKQRILAEFTKEMTDHAALQAPDDDLVKLYEQKTEEFDYYYMSRQGRFAYTPEKTLIDARMYINEIDGNITQTNIGNKLKNISKVK